MSQEVVIAGVQMNIRLGELDVNFAQMAEFYRQARAAGALVTVFPECALSGYCFESYEEASRCAVPLGGTHMRRFAQLCRQLGGYAVVGLLEDAGDCLFNSLALVGANGLVSSYRKIHLPYLGVDRFARAGDRPFEVCDLGVLRLGMNICYDLSFPESARSLALLGADLIVLPTNWPPTVGCTPTVFPNARAMENHVYFMSVDRVGHERGFDFIGKSKICDPHGRDLAFADHAREEILFATIDPLAARNKHLVRVPGEHEIDRFADRRPDMYQVVVQPDPTPQSRTSSVDGG